MNDSSNTAAELDQADEQILTYTISDEALEAAAARGGEEFTYITHTLYHPCCQG